MHLAGASLSYGHISSLLWSRLAIHYREWVDIVWRQPFSTCWFTDYMSGWGTNSCAWRCSEEHAHLPWSNCWHAHAPVSSSGWIVSKIGLGRNSHYRYTIDTEMNGYVSIRSSCCIDTDDSDSPKKPTTIPDSKLFVSHLMFIQLSKKIKHTEFDKTMVYIAQVIIWLYH